MNARLPLSSLGILSLLALLGCHDVDYIEIQPQNLVLKQKNNVIWLQAKAMSHTGVHYAQAPIIWSVKDPEIAKIDEKGRLMPVKSGRTEVIATSRKVRAVAPVDVLFAEKMTVTPSTLELEEGGSSVELVVKVFDYQGRELKDRTATFRSKDEKVVSMGQNAAFPMGPGETQVEVQVEELKQLIDVKVVPNKRASR